MNRVAITAIAANATTGTVCAVLASTGGETTGREAITMAAVALLSIAAVAACVVRAVRR